MKERRGNRGNTRPVTAFRYRKNGWTTGVVRPHADNKSKSTATAWNAVSQVLSVAFCTTRPFLQSALFTMLDGDYTLCGHRLQHPSLFGHNFSTPRQVRDANSAPGLSATESWLDLENHEAISWWILPGLEGRKNSKGRDFLPAFAVLLRFCRNPAGSLERLHVGSLPALRPLHHVELHGLAFLQTLETTRVNRRVVHEDILTVLTRDKAEALRVIKPLHSTLFHFDRVSWIELRWMNRGPLAESLLGWASELLTPGSTLTLW